MRSVLVTVDAVRPDHLGQYGYDRDTMPALDRVLDGGTRFDAAFANGPYSGVSIPSFLTSQYRGREPLENGPNLATALAAAGVATAGVHSNTMLAHAVDGAAGFDVFADFDVAEDEREHERVDRSVRERLLDAAAGLVGPVVADWSPARRIYESLAPGGGELTAQAYVDAATVTDRATAWIADREDDCFLWVHYMDPHRPYGVDPADPAYVDEPVDQREIRDLMVTAGTDPGSITGTQRQRLVDLYDSDLRYTSRHLDRLFDAVDRHWGLDETLVAVTADHGEEFGEHGRYFHRNKPYDELLAVPLAVRHPDRDRERVRKQRELLDLAPTFCEFHGAAVPDAFAGRSLFDGARRRVVATGALDVEGPVAAVRTGAWKYVTAEAGEELYDLDRDPDEQADLAVDEPDLAAALRDVIPADLLTEETVEPERATGATRDRLEELGYLE